MIKYILPAAVAAFALGIPAAVDAQTIVGQPVPLNAPGNPMTIDASANGAMIGQPKQGLADGYNPAAAAQDYNATTGIQPGMTQPGMTQPGMQPMVVAPVPQNSVWIPGHYNWDPRTQNYVWLEGEYSQPPRPGAQWVAGHWQQTPTAWTWVDPRWN